MQKLFFAAATAAAAVAVVAVAAIVACEFYPPKVTAPPPEAKRSEAMAKITHEVIEGRTPLLQAAADFHALVSRSPALVEKLAEIYPADSDGERACKHVITTVRSEFQCQASRRDGLQPGEGSIDIEAGVIARLEAALKAARGPDGTVTLPASKF